MKVGEWWFWDTHTKMLDNTDHSYLINLLEYMGDDEWRADVYYHDGSGPSKMRIDGEAIVLKYIRLTEDEAEEILQGYRKVGIKLGLIK